MNQTATPSSVFVGQQLVNSITVYTNVNIQALKIEEDTPDGFWEEAISDGNKTRKVINGIDYAAIEVSRALFPLKAGALIIPQRKALAKIPVRSRSNPLTSLDPFSDDFFEGFFQRSIIRDKTLATQQLPIEVKALPPAPEEIAPFLRGIPIVGATSLTAHYSETGIKVGESKNISLIVTSEGNLNPLKSLSLRAPEGTKLYEGQVTSKHDTRGAKLLSQKTFSFSIVALEPGVFKIPGASLAHFDADSASYKMTTTPDITFVVTGSPLTSQLPGSQVNPAAKSPIDLNPAPPGASLLPTPAPLPLAPNLSYREASLLETLRERVSLELALLILSATLAAIFLTWLLLRATSSSRPLRVAIERISKAATLSELDAALRGWAAISIPGAKPQCSLDELRALLRAQSSSTGSTLSLLALLDELELACYSNSKQEVNLHELKCRLISCLKER